MGTNVQGVPLSELSPKERMVREMHWSWAAQMQQRQISRRVHSKSQWDIIAEDYFYPGTIVTMGVLFKISNTAFTDYLECFPFESII